jgi:aconitate hydratase
MSKNSFNAKKNLEVAGKSYEIFDISGIEGADSLPFSLKVLLENLLRTEDGANITADHIKALANWNPSAEPDTEIQFTPARVVMQDFTGVPCIVDLATMREAIVDLGGDPSKVNPLAPAELVIDHSVIADVFGSKDSFEKILISNMSAIKSAIAFCVGDKPPLMNSRLCHQEPELFTK